MAGAVEGGGHDRPQLREQRDLVVGERRVGRPHRHHQPVDATGADDGDGDDRRRQRSDGRLVGDHLGDGLAGVDHPPQHALGQAVGDEHAVEGLVADLEAGGGPAQDGPGGRRAGPDEAGGLLGRHPLDVVGGAGQGEGSADLEQVVVGDGAAPGAAAAHEHDADANGDRDHEGADQQGEAAEAPRRGAGGGGHGDRRGGPDRLGATGRGPARARPRRGGRRRRGGAGLGGEVGGHEGRRLDPAAHVAGRRAPVARGQVVGGAQVDAGVDEAGVPGPQAGQAGLVEAAQHLVDLAGQADLLVLEHRQDLIAAVVEVDELGEQRRGVVGGAEVDGGHEVAERRRLGRGEGLQPIEDGRLLGHDHQAVAGRLLHLGRIEDGGRGGRGRRAARAGRRLTGLARLARSPGLLLGPRRRDAGDQDRSDHRHRRRHRCQPPSPDHHPTLVPRADRIPGREPPAAPTGQPRGTNMMTATPTRHSPAPTRSHRSGRKPSTTTPQASEPATKMPP